MQILLVLLQPSPRLPSGGQRLSLGSWERRFESEEIIKRIFFLSDAVFGTERKNPVMAVKYTNKNKTVLLVFLSLVFFKYS